MALWHATALAWRCASQPWRQNRYCMATTVLAMLNWLGVKPSYSRPRVSDDNAYVESLFRTIKYRPGFPAKGFANLDAAQRHAGDDHAILASRHALHSQVREFNPARWSGKTRNWSPVGAVTLNPKRESIIRAHSACNDIQQLAA